MKLQLDTREKHVFQSLASSTEGEILTSVLQKMVRELTNTRNITKDHQLTVEARNKAAEIIEQTLIESLKPNNQFKKEEVRFD